MAIYIESAASVITENDIKKKIEVIGRTCYRSENKIEEGSAEKFVAGIMEKKHYSILEHIPLYIMCDGISSNLAMNRFLSSYESIRRVIHKVPMKPFVTVRNFKSYKPNSSEKFISCTNARTIAEMYDDVCEYSAMCEARVIFANVLRDPRISHFFKQLTTALIKDPRFDFLVNPEIIKDGNFVLENYDKPLEFKVSDMVPSIDDDDALRDIAFRTIKFTCDRGVSHEIVRHRNCAFMQESTRYCDYSDEMKFILPDLYSMDSDIKDTIFDLCKRIEYDYDALIEYDVKPEIARCILPNALATTLIVTASINEWDHIFDLRLFDKGGVAHPQIKEVMKKAYLALIDRDGMMPWWNKKTEE